MCKGRWWYDTEWGKPKYPETNLRQFQLDQPQPPPKLAWDRTWASTVTFWLLAG